MVNSELDKAYERIQQTRNRAYVEAAKDTTPRELEKARRKIGTKIYKAYRANSRREYFKQKSGSQNNSSSSGTWSSSI